MISSTMQPTDFFVSIDFDRSANNFSEHIDSSSTLLFDGGRLVIRSSSRSAIVTDDNSGVTVFLHGEIFGPDFLERQRKAHVILEAYIENKDKESFALSLNGHFVLIILDKSADKIEVFTDRIGFRKCFIRRTENKCFLSSCPSAIAFRGIDPVGAFTFLTNAFIFSGRTVFADVRALDRACIVEISKKAVRSRSYWKYCFPGGDSSIEMKNSFNEYSRLMRESVERRVPVGGGRVYVSLSGGIDSRAVLGCLLDVVDDRDRILAFCYGTDNDEDVIYSKRVAAYAGVEHRCLNFEGDLSLAIQSNASYGEGLVGFYTHGIDGLIQLAGDFRVGDVLFVGDLPVQRGKRNFDSLNDVLYRGMEIRTSKNVPSYYGYGSFTPAVIECGVLEDLEWLKGRCDHLTCLQDVHDFFFLDQRTSNMLLPWREFHAGRHITVCDPFLDNSILEFYSRSPRCFRYDKTMHRYTTEKMFGGLCSIGYGKSGVNNSFIFAQLLEQLPSLRKLCLDFPSYLDELLPPELVDFALWDTVQTIRLHNSVFPEIVTRLVRRLQRRYARSKLIRGLPAEMSVGGAGLPNLGVEPLLRWLTLRVLLSRGITHEMR